MTEAPLSNRRAIVTGATRGIGRAIAERLLSAGAIVTATGTRSDGAPPEGCTYHAVDFTDSAATAAFADRLAAEPTWVTEARGGHGFVELADALIAARDE